MRKTFLLLSLFTVLVANATVYYVNPSHPSASDSNWGDSPDSPWATLNIANWNEDDTIMVSVGTYTLTEKGYINKKATVIGESKDGVIIQGEDDMPFNFNTQTCRFFSIGADAEATFNNLTLKNLIYDWKNGETDATATYGGVFELTSTSILNLKNVDIKKTRIYGNGGNAWGAAIMNRGIVNADSCLFEACYATQGGAIYALDGSTTNLSNCKFLENGNPEASDYDTYRFGGAICMTGASTINIDKCYFENNFTESNGNGGVIMLRYDSDKITTLSISNSTFNNNTSAYGGSVLYCGANTAATTVTELNISFKNCVFYKNIGNVSYMQYNNTISLPTTQSNSYAGKGRFIFVNNSLFGNFNSARSNTRSISIGDVNMEYYFINNLMNDNENDDGTAQTDTYGLVLEGSYSITPTKIAKMIVLGNVFNATGGAFSSVNYPDLDVSLYPEKKNYLGQRLVRTQQQTNLITPETGVPYLEFTTVADSISAALNNGVNEYLLDEVNIVPQTDITGNEISGLTRDAGAWEMQVSGTGIHKITQTTQFVYPNPFTNVINIEGTPEYLEIYNFTGQNVLRLQNPNNIIDVSNLETSMYIIKSTKNGDIKIQKALKK